jgi:hypothetical protein
VDACTRSPAPRSRDSSPTSASSRGRPGPLSCPRRPPGRTPPLPTGSPSCARTSRTAAGRPPCRTSATASCSASRSAGAETPLRGSCATRRRSGQRWARLPDRPTPWPRGHEGVFLVFDPAVSPEYETLHCSLFHLLDRETTKSRRLQEKRSRVSVASDAGNVSAGIISEETAGGAEEEREAAASARRRWGSGGGSCSQPGGGGVHVGADVVVDGVPPW